MDLQESGCLVAVEKSLKWEVENFCPLHRLRGNIGHLGLPECFVTASELPEHLEDTFRNVKESNSFLEDDYAPQE